MDPLSIAGSILGAAATGAKLSLTLYEFATSLGSAGKDVRRVAADFRTFAQVLRLVHTSLKNATRIVRYSDVVNGAAELVDPLVNECKTIYKEADDLMESLKAINEEGSWTFRMKAQVIKIGWLFQKSRIEVLNGRLRNFQGTLQLLLATVDLEMAIQDKLPPDVIEGLENEKKSSIKIAEFQGQELDQVLLEAKFKKEEASSLASESIISLTTLCAWTPPKLDPKPERAVMQLALLGSDNTKQQSTPNASPRSRSNSEITDPKLSAETKRSSQSESSKLKTYVCGLGCGQTIPLPNQSVHESLHRSYFAIYDYNSINPTHLNFSEDDVISNVGSPPMAWWSNASLLPSSAWLFGSLYGNRGAFPRDRVRGYFEDEPVR